MEASSMNVMGRIGLLIVFILLTACSSGLDELKTLCEKDAGLTIYKTVEADGYYDATSIGIGANLIESDYQFMEFCNDDPKFTRAITEPGCWRVSKVKRELGICYERLDNMLAKNVVEPYPEFLKEHCIAVERLDKPEAMYSYHSDPKQWLDKNGKSEFRRSDAYIKDVATFEVLGRFVSYSYNEKPRHTSPTSCNRFGDEFPSYAEANLINTVLKPISKGVSHD
jgi:hypothetical protein